MRYLMSLLFVLSLSGCFVEAYSDTAVPGADVVYVSDGVYYREVYIHGEAHRFYYNWHPRYGWTYHNRVIMHGHRH